MKFYRAKNDERFCNGCHSNILYGEHYIQHFIPGVMRMLFFHIDCFRKWEDNRIVRKYLAWKQDIDPPKVRGRPKKYRNPKEANRLKTRLNQHKETGNDIMVEELGTKIKELEL